MNLSNEQMLELYEWMLWERLLDQRANEIFRMGKLMSMYHSALGQEAVNMGSMYALKDEMHFYHSIEAKPLTS